MRLPWEVPLLDIIMTDFLEELEGVELLVSAAGASRLGAASFHTPPSDVNPQ